MPVGIVLSLVISMQGWAQNLPEKVSLPIRVESLQDLLSSQTPCSEPQSAILCRNWAWTFRSDEGAYFNGTVATIVFNTEPPEVAHEELTIARSLSKERWEEAYILLLLSNEKFVRAINQAVPNIFFFILKDPKKPRPRAALLLSKNGLTSFLSTGRDWRQQAITKTLWFIPNDFTPFYQFQSF